MNQEIERQIHELDELVHKMIFASQYKELEKEFAKIKGLSITEITIISIVSQKEDVILRDILDSLKVPKSTLTSLINRLEEKNLLRRRISSRDKRSYGLELTEEGKLVQNEHVNMERAMYRKIMMSLETEEERDELLSLIRKIVNNLNN